MGKPQKYLTLIYEGDDSNCLYTCYFDGKNWTGNTKISKQPGGISPQSKYYPGGTIFNNYLYLLYKGEDKTNLYYAWFDGEKWNGNCKVAICSENECPNPDFQGNEGNFPKTSHGLSAAVFRGALYTVFKEEDSVDLYSAGFNGTEWYGGLKIRNQTGGISPVSDFNPGMAVFQNRLYIVYKQSGSMDLYYAWFDGLSWFGNNKIPIQPDAKVPCSNFSPCAVVFREKLYIIYKDAASNSICYAWLGVDKKWYGGTKIEGDINPQTCNTPGACVYMDKLFIFYREVKKKYLHYSTFDGSKWSGDVKIKTGKSYPESDFCPSAVRSGYITEDLSRWMEKLNDSISIADINIPGTHDSAAINSIGSVYACHNVSIAEQLTGGIRLLDIRLKVKKDKKGNYEFITCHGNIGSYTGMNEFEPFTSVLKTCRDFVYVYKSEFIIMSLKIDDWSSEKNNKYNVLKSLQQLLGQYTEIISPSSLPALKSVRGKIITYSRIDDNEAPVGIPIDWKDNTEGMRAYPDKSSDRRKYPVYVQDKWQGLSNFSPEEEKLKLVTNAFVQKKNGIVLWNFASATRYYVFGVYIHLHLLNYFGQYNAEERTEKIGNFGWILFDHPFKYYETDNYSALDIVEIIISSNFCYPDYENPFKVIYPENEILVRILAETDDVL